MWGSLQGSDEMLVFLKMHDETARQRPSLGLAVHPESDPDPQVHNSLQGHAETHLPIGDVIEAQPLLEIPLIRRGVTEGDSNPLGFSWSASLNLSSHSGACRVPKGDNPHHNGVSTGEESHSNGTPNGHEPQPNEPHSAEFNHMKTMLTQSSNLIPVGVARNDRHYNMDHPRRGKALVFNHEVFHEDTELSRRDGTNQDRERLVHALGNLGFEVIIFNDKTYQHIMEAIDKVAQENHQQCDCLIVCILSHGEHGMLYAYDRAYKPHFLWAPFTADRCPSLAGKPKMFFIQACRGTDVDDGVSVTQFTSSHTHTDSILELDSYRIPVQADFLIAHSTNGVSIAGYYSWRSGANGSWFIQSLCEVLLKYSNEEDLMSMLAEMTRIVGIEHESNVPNQLTMHHKKQVPAVTTTLTRRNGVSIAGYYSWRSGANGSWFIQSLCEVLLKYSNEEDLMSMLAEMTRIVGIEHESNVPNQLTMHHKKQVPAVTTTLTRRSSDSIPIGVARHDPNYKMDHLLRGKALVFNHEFFCKYLKLPDREGTIQDRDRLVHALGHLGFQVEVYNNKPFQYIMKVIKKVADDDHQQCDCLVVCFMSHGENGMVYAYDQLFKPEHLWSPFTADCCPSLAGKPKMFFIQFCSFSERCYSYRNSTVGSWFIQSLCAVLMQHSQKEDLMSMLTEVARKVAIEYESHIPEQPALHRKKQVPTIATTLIRKVFFTPKSRGTIIPSAMP
ncbi:unnamed protein product, partial [Darwinula stevensoni]